MVDYYVGFSDLKASVVTETQLPGKIEFQASGNKLCSGMQKL